MDAAAVAKGYRANPNNTSILWDSFSTVPIGMGVKKGEDKMLSILNEFISKFDEPNGVKQELKNDWDNTINEILGENQNLDFFLNE